MNKIKILFHVYLSLSVSFIVRSKKEDIFLSKSSNPG